MPGRSGESYYHSKFCRLGKATLLAQEVSQDISDPDDFAAFFRDYEEQERFQKKSKIADPTSVKRRATAAELPDEPELSPGAASSGGYCNVIYLDMSSFSEVGAIVNGKEYHIIDEFVPMECDYYDEESGHLLDPVEKESSVRSSTWIRRKWLRSIPEASSLQGRNYGQPDGVPDREAQEPWCIPG